MRQWLVHNSTNTFFAAKNTSLGTMKVQADLELGESTGCGPPPRNQRSSSSPLQPATFIKWLRQAAAVFFLFWGGLSIINGSAGRHTTFHRVTITSSPTPPASILVASRPASAALAADRTSPWPPPPRGRCSAPPRRPGTWGGPGPGAPPPGSPRSPRGPAASRRCSRGAWRRSGALAAAGERPRGGRRGPSGGSPGPGWEGECGTLPKKHTPTQPARKSSWVPAAAEPGEPPDRAPGKAWRAAPPRPNGGRSLTWVVPRSLAPPGTGGR